MARPTFLGIGAARCGTTSLYDYLRAHPAVEVPSRKELNWFGWDGDRWMAPRAEPNAGGVDQDYYEGHFFNSYRERGEISPPYQFLLPNISVVYPGIPLIMCVRSPVERMTSHLRMALSWYSAVQQRAMLRWHAGPNSLLIRSGVYRDTVLQAESLGFPLHVVDFRRLRDHQQEAWDGVCNFLSVSRFRPLEHIHGFDGAGHKIAVDIPQKLIDFAKKHYAESNRFMLEKFGIDLESS